MSTNCEYCGYKSNDVKSGGATQDFGCKLTDVDMARDVLKSDTCSLMLLELEVEMGCGALSGRFTTIEGLLIAIKDQLKSQFAFFMGDSATDEERQKMEHKLQELEDVLALKKSCTLVMDDPAGNTPLIDERLTKGFYKRSYEQDDELGLNDMKTENYQVMDPIVEDNENEN